MKIKEEYRQESEEYLKNVLVPGMTIYGQFIRVNPAGTVRVYSFYAIHNNELIYLNRHLSYVLRATLRHSQTSGTGIDTGADDGTWLVRQLSVRLFGANGGTLTYYRFV